MKTECYYSDVDTSGTLATWKYTVGEVVGLASHVTIHKVENSYYWLLMSDENDDAVRARGPAALGSRDEALEAAVEWIKSH